MAGLWSDHFPASEKTPERFPSSSSKAKVTWSEHFPSAQKPPSLPAYKRCFLCRKCDVNCRLQTSTTPQNPNRKFYTCPAPPTDHRFFKWADEVSPDEFIDVPNCGGCKSGTCRVWRAKHGPNSGRVLFMCRIKEGEGSCGYRVWKDELEKAAAIGGANENITPSQSPATINSSCTSTNLFQENRQSNGKSNNEPTVVDISSHPPDFHGVTSKNTEHLESRENQFNGSPWRDETISDGRVTPTSSPTSVTSNRTTASVEGNYTGSYESSRRAYRLSGVTRTLFPSPAVEENIESNEGDDSESPVVHTLQQMKFPENVPSGSSSGRAYKRSRHGDLKAPSSLISSQPLTVGATMNPVLVEHCWMVAAIRENLSTQLQGWWGRLAFHPMPSLTTHASKPLNYYVSSPLASTFTSQDKILVKSVNLTTPTKILLGAETHNKSILNPCHSTQLSRTKPFHPLNTSPCANPPPEMGIQAIMSESISKTFTQVAEHLQKDFLALLDKMEVTDYEAMNREAEATFSALDRLLFNYQDFKGRTEEYIYCATSLVEIERSMPGYESYQKQIEHYSSERMRYDEVCSDYAKAVDSMNCSRKRLKSLRAKVSSTMDWLFQMEAELSCFEAKMSITEQEVEKISKDKEELEEKYASAARELERSMELIEQKEAERDAAKAALERARKLLRG